MKVLMVYAHPEPQSLNGSLKNLAVETLRQEGHEVQVSDLYAMRWKAVADAADFGALQHPERLDYGHESGHAFRNGTQTPDIAAEQAKLLWADAVIFQFPLWWFSLPAILKGWFERVYAYGFGYGVGQHSGSRWGERYGEGTLQGRRAMLSVTMGGREPHYGPRGVNGPIEELLFPIHHGILYYPGMEVLPPFLVYEARGIDAAAYEQLAQVYRERLRRLFTDAPLPYRMQNGGDYDERQVLKDTIAPGTLGFSAHLRRGTSTAPRQMPAATSHVVTVEPA
ncbi:MAG: NAD(P)H-dependent oxidoreductase [Nevskia sp.]|nr:NAD(P)H-dependent oxidoreductase [Nevskia sp.]